MHTLFRMNGVLAGNLVRQFGTGKPVQTDSGFGSLKGKVTVHFGRNPDHEFSTIASGGKGLGRLFIIFPHIIDYVHHYLPYAF